LRASNNLTKLSPNVELVLFLKYDAYYINAHACLTADCIFCTCECCRSSEIDQQYIAVYRFGNSLGCLHWQQNRNGGFMMLRPKAEVVLKC